jgi:hypothetical protein
VLPRGARAVADVEPRRLTQLAVRAAVRARAQHFRREVGEREVRDRIAPRLEEDHGVVAADDRLLSQLGAQPAPQRLRVQDAIRHAGDEELPVGVAAERPLLP